MGLYTERSWRELQTCDQLLIVLFVAVAREVDCTILEGRRSKERQLELYRRGKSKVTFGLHNETPSRAVDVAPSPIDWNDTPRFEAFAAVVLRKADELDIPIRWGGNWARDWDRVGPRPKQRFDDLVHFELVDG